MATEHVDTIIIGGGQAGLSVGYHLKTLGERFLILDANERTGDSWRQRWDSLRLFTPAKLSALDGLSIPTSRNAFITKGQMADYLEDYARHFELPIRHGLRVERLTHQDGRFVIEAGDRSMTADQVVVAMGHCQVPRIPEFADQLAPAITQLHSMEYRNPTQLRPGGVLIVGAGNSGAEIARELAAEHQVWVAGRDVGQLPFRVESFLGTKFFAPMVLRGLFHRVLTMRTPIGRRMRPKVAGHSGPLIRVRRKHLSALGVQYVGRVFGSHDGKPALEDGATLDVENVIWCTGFTAGFSWIDLPIMHEGHPVHERGVVPALPGLYFVGLEFLYALSSEMIHGVGRDARYVAEHLARHANKRRASGASTLREAAPVG